MKKLSALAILTALVISACGGSGSTAATVDGTAIPVSEVQSLADLSEMPSNNLSKAEFAGLLNFKVRSMVMVAAAEADYGVTVTEEEITAGADAAFEELGPEGMTREEFLKSEGVTEEFFRMYVQLTLIDDAVSELMSADFEATQEAIDQRRDALILGATEVCASHILVGLEDEDLADDLLQQLEDGADFAELAEEHSIDGSAADGGSLGCSSPAAWVVPFREASLATPVGELSDVVESEFGYHILLVHERTPADEDDIPSEEEIAELLATESLQGTFQIWLLDSLRKAEVTVEPRYGQWVLSPQPGIVPPEE